MSRLARLTARMDQLYEYDREPVEESALEPGRHFAGLFAGEHVAATEFVIGAFFVLTLFACFPAVFLKLLDYVALYGLVLMPIGAIVFAEHWLFPRLGLPRYRAEAEGAFVNWRAVFVWAGTLAACHFMPLHLFYRWLPRYGIALAGYVALGLATRRT